MEIMELLKDSLFYPIKELDKLLIFGVLFIIMSIFGILQIFGISLYNYVSADILAIISFIILFVILMFIYGYIISIVRKTINNVSGDVPKIDLSTNFVNGLKLLVLNIVYYIIPVAITLIVAYVTDAFNILYEIFLIYANTGSTSAILQSLSTGPDFSFLIVTLIVAILYVIFTWLLWIATAVLAETDSLVAAIHMGDVFKKIGKISWKNFIVWIIIVGIISTFINYIENLIILIPFIGFIITLLIIHPFIEMFKARTLGLIYNESKK